MSRALLPVVALLLLLAACAEPDAADPPPDYFVRATDFPDRTSCQRGAVAGWLPATALYHMDIHLDGSPPFPRALRFADGQAFIDGRPWDAAEQSADGLLLRHAYSAEGQLPDGTKVREQHIWAHLFCIRPTENMMAGLVARCRRRPEVDPAPDPGRDCRLGTFSAVRVARRPGEGLAHGLRLVGQIADFPGSPPGAVTLNVRVRGTLAFLARDTDGLRIVDLADPARPQAIGHLPVELAADDTRRAEFYNDIKLAGDLALLASSRSGLVVADISDPHQPRRLNSLRQTDGQEHNVHTLAVAGDRAYLADIDLGGLRIVSLSDPMRLETIATFVLPEKAAGPRAHVAAAPVFLHDLSLHDRRAFLNFWGGGFAVVDLGGPEPRLTGRATYERMTSHASWVTQVGARLFALHGDEDFGAHLRVYDVTNATEPEAPQELLLVGQFSLRPEVSIHNLIADGKRALAAYYQDGLRMVELSSLGVPRQVAYYNTWAPETHPGDSFYEGAIGVDLDPATGRIYVADTHRGLLVLEEER